MNTAFITQNQDRFLEELFSFLSIPSVSTTPIMPRTAGQPPEWLVTHFRQLGCPVATILEGAGHPIVWAESPGSRGRPPC